MKAYAVDMEGCYFLVYAPTGAKAKGMLITRYGMMRIRCRRWSELDRVDDDRVEVCEWGYPGSKDYETGTRIAMPEPFQEAAR